MVINIVIMFILVLVSSILNYVHTKGLYDDDMYLDDGLDETRDFIAFKAGVSFYLLLNQLLPIGLVVNSEIVKIFLTYFIEQDAKMHSSTMDKKCKVLNFQIHEDLASVKHVFSDKTGTLTANKLTFRGLVLDNHTFEGNNEILLASEI